MLLLVILYSAIAMATTTTPSRDAINKSKSDQVSKIQATDRETAPLKRSIGRWNSANLVCLLLTAFAGIGAYLTSRELVGKNAKLATIQETRTRLDQEMRALEAQEFQLDLGEKDIAISKANQAASEADNRAGEANRAAGTANERAGKLENEAADARDKTEKLRKQNLETEGSLEKERSARVLIEKGLAPRNIPFVMQGVSISTEKILKPCPVNATIEFVPEFEARRAATQLRLHLEHSGWTVTRFQFTTEDFPDGVRIFWAPPPRADDPTQTLGQWDASPQHKKAFAAAIAVETLLKDSGWLEVASGFDKIRTTPAGTLKIEVGLKSSLNFLSPPFDALRGLYESSPADEASRRLFLEQLQKKCSDPPPNQ